MPDLVGVDLAQPEAAAPLAMSHLSASTGPMSIAWPITCLDTSGVATTCAAASTLPYVPTASSKSLCWKPFDRQPEVTSGVDALRLAVAGGLLHRVQQCRIQLGENRVGGVER